jgi:hypothetical protein
MEKKDYKKRYKKIAKSKWYKDAYTLKELKKKTKIIFDDKSILFVLEALGKTTDKNGYVIDVKTRKVALDVDGNKFKPKDIVAMTKGNWITSIFQFLPKIVQ